MDARSGAWLRRCLPAAYDRRLRDAAFPGGHFFLRDHAVEINRLIGEWLAGVAARQPVP